VTITELADDRFVRFEGDVAAYGGLAISASDLSARVFVGRKGAGKTVYLRRAQAYAQDQPDLFADTIQQQLPTTTQVFGVNRWFSPAVLVQVWMSIWRLAIIRSLFSYLAYEELLETAATGGFVEHMKRDYGEWLPEQRDPMTVYSQVRAIIRVNRSRDELVAFLEHEDWDAIERRLARHLRGCKPVYFYLDAIDEEFRHAPTHWLMCQKGLFYQVMRFVRDHALGGRLHVVIAIRDLVYSSVMQTEHMTRYVDPERIRLLEWTPAAIRYLMRVKIDNLDRRLWVGDPSRGGLGGWLGIDRIENAKRGVSEDVERYLLRHTRLIPRDIVILLNMLHVEVNGSSYASSTARSERIRDVVARAARMFGSEQLGIAANQLAIGDLPVEAVEDNYVDIYSGEHPAGTIGEMRDAPGIEFDRDACRYRYRGLDVYEGDNPVLQAAAAYQAGLVEELSEVVRGISTDRFDQKVFRVAEDKAERRFPGGRAMSVLWQNGLLGYTEGAYATGQAHFYTATRADPLEIPSTKPGYVLHPCLIDALGISSYGDVVYPYE
jgi:hypothetical protein